ncbi:MAG: hypothetical protein QXV17_13905 [Candidatus Micrarchaeaceae archaeon]
MKGDAAFTHSLFVLPLRYHDDSAHAWKSVGTYFLSDDEIVEEAVTHLLISEERLGDGERETINAIGIKPNYSISDRLATVNIALDHKELWLSAEIDCLQQIRRKTTLISKALERMEIGAEVGSAVK